ncbi:MAG: glycoside hydrolase family 75 protein [Chitinivibrionales bacterium]|nr:glycoside hydrolase family 75 protein [Chitinivibrionales bacterium]
MRRYVTLVMTICFLTSFVWSEGNVPAEKLLELVKRSTDLTPAVFDVDGGKIPIKEFKGKNVLLWQGDMDIDCDGKESSECNKQKDPWFQPQTSVGADICASVTPFFVIPVPSSEFNYKNNNIKLGQIGAVIYNNQVAYGPFLDECGEPYLIGEASYAMAKLLGINPDPKNGGIDKGVTYMVFTGTTGLLKNYSDHNQAVQIGSTRAQELIDQMTTKNDKMKSGNLSVFSNVQIRSSSLLITSTGSHTIEIFTSKGQKILTNSGTGFKEYSLSGIGSLGAVYVVRITIEGVAFTKSAFLF